MRKGKSGERRKKAESGEENGEEKRLMRKVATTSLPAVDRPDETAERRPLERRPLLKNLIKLILR